MTIILIFDITQPDLPILCRGDYTQLATPVLHVVQTEFLYVQM